ncbi:MAG: sulfotransferase [Planctomycetales bacterium]|nr:sulfotransferase [Planctomycetales bacterium]NIM10022.1 sulfotransferase [Planctomycetales bacterium]NIN09463.1 sulfotransferase [Planctomycetales bacterium]NIN78571.1 sulfotransferase [Planctomycetales bacterium]NIO35763.1 sulfotransferase [Planctomycetales bacterium]
MAKKSPEKFNNYPLYSPRFWHGMRTGDYFHLLQRHRFRIHPLSWAMAAILLPCTMFNSALYRLQRWRYGQQIDDVTIDQPPVFIVGHWRSGTTLMHELMVCDDRFTYPNTYECFTPHHFVISEWILPRLLWILMPRKRPMDNMPAGFERPQEDEFALCAMGAPTPYNRMAFPNDPYDYSECLDADAMSDWQRQQFSQALQSFLKALTLMRGKRIILKSPPHTGRIGLLAQMFPGARFVHMVRHPYALFPSTRRTWQALDAAQGFQIPHHKHLDDYVFNSLNRMYEAFERQKAELDPAHICQVRYEDLVADPLSQLEHVYQHLQLGDFDYVRGPVEDFLVGQRDYQANRHELAPQLKAEIDRRWSAYLQRYDYQQTEVPAA